MTREPQVGRFYTVPCVQLYTHVGKNRPPQPHMWVPVHGPVHEDAEIIGFPFTHRHVDVRFMSDRQLKRYCPSWVTTPQELTAMLTPVSDSDRMARYAPSLETTLRRRKCYRAMPTFRAQSDRVIPWMWALEEKYRRCRLDPDNPVCPHRGFYLGDKPEVDGVVVCPGHGLTWNIRTGRLIPRGG